MSDKIDPAHKKLFIEPSRDNQAFYTFLVLPDNRIVAGKLQIGGNCLRFFPIPNLRSLQYAQNKYNSTCFVQILTQSIYKVALCDTIQKTIPSKLSILRAVSGNAQLQRQQFQVILPSLKESNKQRFFDLELLNQILENPEESVFKRLETLSNPTINQSAPRYLKIRTFQNNIYTFFSTSTMIQKICNELLEFTLKCNSFNKSELIYETSGSEDFDFYEIQQPYDAEKALQKIIRDNCNEFGFDTRHCCKYSIKQRQKAQKMSGADQIKFLQEKNFIQQKRLLNKKKFDSSNYNFQKPKFEYNKNYSQYSNLWPDQFIQQEYSKNQLKREASESDLVIEQDCEFPEQQKYKITRGIIVNANDDHETSMALFGEALNEILIHCGVTKTQQVSTRDDVDDLDKEMEFKGRKSIILSVDDINNIKQQINSKYAFYRTYVQYQSPTDGTYLNNMFESYRFDKRTSFGALINSVGDLGDRNEVLNINNINVDNAQFSGMHLMAFKTQNGDVIIVCADQNPPLLQGQFCTDKCFLLVKREGQFVKYVTTNSNSIYLVKKDDRLIVGSGQGSALTVFRNLIDVTTAQCETFDSPPLFDGNKQDKFIESKIVNAEVLRFIVGGDL